MSTAAESREVVASEALLTRVIAIDDTMTEAYSARANVRARLGKFDDAIADYQRAIELEPTEKGYYLNLGSVYAQKEDLEMAVEALSASFEVYLRAAQATEEGEGDEETEPQEPEPVFVAPLLNRARFLIEIGKQSTDEGTRAEAYGRAVADCDQSIEMLQDAPRQFGDLAFAHYQRGIVYEEMEDYEESVRSFTDALQISTGLAGAYSRRGIVWFKLGDDELALIDLNEAVQLNPTDMNAHLYRGFTLVRQEKYREAIAAYTKALERNDQFVPALNNRGLAYFKDGQYAKAIEDFNEMLLINPKDATAYFKRGVTYMVMEDYDRAITALSGATRVDPNYAIAHERLGDTYDSLGQVADARQHHAEAARLRADQGATTP